MFRGTTATLVFNINSNVDLNNIDVIFVTLKSKIGGKTRDYTKNMLTIDADNHKIFLPLSQNDTLYFKGSKYYDEGKEVEVQIRIKDKDSNAYASNIMTLVLDDILKDGEI